MKYPLTVLMFLQLAGILLANRATTYTYTPSSRGRGRFTRTGDTYLPGAAVTTLGLDEPQDLHIAPGDMLYIADTGNARILIYDIPRGRPAGEIRDSLFRTPTGVWLAPDSLLYVADPAAKLVIVLTPEGERVRTYERPVAAAFGDRNFAPRKLAVDAAGNLFIIGEGLYDGVIQLSPQGRFLGYFTSNRINLSFTERLQDLFFTEEQKANLPGRTPVTFSNLYLDHRNILYTTTIGDSRAVKKHNAAGRAIVSGIYGTEGAAVDLCVSPQGAMAAVFDDGETVVYTRDGTMIAVFGYSSRDEDVAGLFDTPSSIAMDSSGTLWYLDGAKAFLQSYEPTPYITNIYDALARFDQGDYSGSIRVWKDVLEVNQVSQAAHLSIGKSYLFQGNYPRALYHTRIADDRHFYSQAFWEIRNLRLQRSVVSIVGAVALLALGVPIFRFLRHRYAWADYLLRPARAFAALPPVRNFLFQFRLLKNPSDGFYELREEREGSAGAALVIYTLFFGVFLLFAAGRGFIHQKVPPEDIDFLSLLLGYAGIIALFILSNYLAASIHNGRGDMGALFTMLAYTGAPLWTAMALNVALSHVLTANEVFAMRLISGAGWTWWGIQLIVALRETHDYSTRAAVSSILYSLLFMVIIVVLGVIVTIMGRQVWQFFTAAAKELVRNVS